MVANALAADELTEAIRINGDKLLIDYEPTAPGSGYVAPMRSWRTAPR
ncbi:hypothetical protein ACRRRS_18625 [Brucella anthropi]